ncbi:MAG: hypothetical protein K2J91_07290 [Lachnospiraceae bacterium]|nr:hypothetical protein [Lachnospiraceae bacterium]
MSQEKVDLYKKEKANRKKNVKKQKRVQKLKIFAAVAVMLMIIGIIAFSIIIQKKENETQTLSQEEYESIMNYLNELYSSTTTSDENATTGEGTTTGENVTTGEGATTGENATTGEATTTENTTTGENGTTSSDGDSDTQ